MKKKILITGGSSFLATNWCYTKSDDYEIILGLNKTKSPIKKKLIKYLNYGDENILINEILEIKPDIIIHTIGLTNVDECEKFPELSFLLNSKLAQTIAKIAKSLSIHFVHISTDHLFKGEKKYVEESERTCPINIYGKSKADGENKVIKENPSSLVIRTNFFGWGTKSKLSITDWIICNLKNNIKINAFDDVFFTPILIEDLVTCIYCLLEAGSVGIYNISGNERVSKYDFALKTADIFSLNKDLIVRSSIDDYKFLAKRPYDMSLSNNKLNKEIDYTQKSLLTSLEKLKHQLSANTFNNILIRFKKNNSW